MCVGFACMHILVCIVNDISLCKYLLYDAANIKAKKCAFASDTAHFW